MGFNFPPSPHIPHLLSRTGTSCELCLSFTFCRGDLCQTSFFFSSLEFCRSETCFLLERWVGQEQWLSWFQPPGLEVSFFGFFPFICLFACLCLCVHLFLAEFAVWHYKDSMQSITLWLSGSAGSYIGFQHLTHMSFMGDNFLLGTGCCGTERLFFQIVDIFPKCMYQTGDVCSMTLHCFESA